MNTVESAIQISAAAPRNTPPCETQSPITPRKIMGAYHLRFLEALLKDDSAVAGLAAGRSLLPCPNLELLNNGNADLQQHAVVFNTLNAILPPEHPAPVKLQELLDEIMSHAGILPGAFKIEVYHNILPDAHIDLAARRVRISATLLNVINYDEDMAAAILGHEIGHLLLLDKEILGSVGNLEDYLEDKAGSYEDEYRADRISAIFMTRTRRNPEMLIDALVLIEKFYRDLKNKIIEIKGAEMYNDEEFYLSWIFSSHPHLRRRIFSMKALCKKLPVSAAARAKQPLPEVNLDDFSFRESEIDDNDVRDERCRKGIIEDFEGMEDRMTEADVDLSQYINNDPEASLFPLSLAPEEVNESCDDPELIRGWWDEAIDSLADWDTQADLRDDLKKYSTDTVKKLLLGMPVASYYQHQNLETVDDFLDNIANGMDSDPDEPLDVLMGEMGNLHYALFGICALLVGRLLEECGDNPEGIRGILELMREFRTKTGFYLPYDQVRFRDRIGKVFNGGKTAEEKRFLIGLIKEYLPELKRGGALVSDLAKTVIPINEWIGREGGGEEQAIRMRQKKLNDEYKIFMRMEEFDIRKKFPLKDLPIEIVVSGGIDEITVDVEKKTLYIPRTYVSGDFSKVLDLLRKTRLRCINIFLPQFDNGTPATRLLQQDVRKTREEITQKLTEIIDLLVKRANTQTIPEIRELMSGIPGRFKSGWLVRTAETLESDLLRDHAREVNPDVKSAILSQEEFIEEYFGRGRETFEQLPYESVQSGTRIAGRLEDLWDRSGYQRELDAIPGPLEKCYFILDKYPSCSACRDKRIVDALGWRPLVYIGDLEFVAQDISKCEDISLLLSLLDGFWHPVLILSCSRRLWELKEQSDGFMEKVPPVFLQKAVAPLEQIPRLGPEEKNELIAINLCYPFASYLKDDLLQAYIDGAEDEEKTMAICQFLVDPPPAAVGKRETSQLVMGESILDLFDKMETVDKEEAMLYMLGQRDFFSVVDMDFYEEKPLPKIRGQILYGDLTIADYRRKAIVEVDLDPFDDPKNIDESVDTHTKDGLAFDSRRLVEVPDSIMYLTKMLGMPVELIFKQGKISTTRREQRTLLEAVLFGEGGIMRGANAKKFIRRTAELIVKRGKFGEKLDADEREAFIKLFAFALGECPKEKLPDLFLQCWYLSNEESLSMPDLVCKLMQQYGAVFIKAGQYLATRTANLPPDWLKAFRRLSDGNTLSDKTLIYEYEYAAYGGQTPFTSIGAKLAEGSMAAVYRGKLSSEPRTGLADMRETDVAVKIIHPWIGRELADDIAFLEKLVTFVNDNRAVYKVSLPSNLAEVTRKQLLREMDTSREAQNNDLMRAILARHENGVGFSLPAYRSGSSNEMFYVMDYVEGVALDDDEGLAALGLDGREMRNTAGIEVLRQIMKEGVYQADPNMGNFKVSRDADGKPIIHWLDCGHVGKLTKEQIALIKSLIVSAVFLKDKKNVADLMACMIQGEADSGKIEKWLEGTGFNTLGFEGIETLLNSFLDFCIDENYILDECWVTLFRTLGLLKPLLKDADTFRILSVTG